MSFGGYMKAIGKHPGHDPHTVWIQNTLADLQSFVGGYIEVVRLDDDLVIVCDEEGRLKGKDFNCYVDGIGFVGSILALGTNGDDFTDSPIEISEFERLVEE